MLEEDQRVGLEDTQHKVLCYVVNALDGFGRGGVGCAGAMRYVSQALL